MPTYQRKFTIAPASGSPDAAIAAMSGSIGVIDNSLEELKNKPLATPQTEVSSGIISVNNYQISGAAPVFVGHAGAVAPMLIGFAVPVVGASGNEVSVIDITSDAAGLNSVVGTGYVLNPYVIFSEAIPGVAINLRYGTQNTLAGLPESVFLVEPMKIAEVQADTQAWIAAIKGEGYDAAVPTERNLLGLDGRIDASDSAITSIQGAMSGLSSSVAYVSSLANAHEAKIGAGLVKEFGIAPEFSNMVFEEDGLVEANGTWLGGLEMDISSVHTYLEWSTNVPSPMQKNRIRIMVKLPDNFGIWHSLEPIKIWCKGAGNVANIGLNMSLHDSFGTATEISNEPIPFTSPDVGTWVQHTISGPINGMFTPNSWACLTLEVSAQDVANTVKIGRIDFKYITL